MTSEHRLLGISSLLDSFIAGPNRSIAAAGEIEVALDDLFPDDEEVQDYVSMFASYRPEGGDYLYNEAQMVEKSKSLLALLRSRPSPIDPGPPIDP